MLMRSWWRCLGRYCRGEGSMKFVQIREDIVINLEQVCLIRRKSNKLLFVVPHGEVEAKYESEEECLSVWRSIGKAISDECVEVK